MGQAARPAPHRGSQARRALAVRRHHGRHRAGHPVPVGVRVLHRELAAVTRRSPLPDGLQPGRDPAPPRSAQRDGRAGPLGRPPPPAVAQRDQRAGGRRAAHHRQLRADPAVLRELRRPGGDRRRGRGDGRRRGRGQAARRPDRREGIRALPGRAGHPGRGPVHPVLRRAAHLQLPDLAVRLRRVRVPGHAVPRLRPPAPVAGLRDLRPPRPPLRRRRAQPAAGGARPSEPASPST